MNIISIIALIIATVIPLVVLYIIYNRDLYGMGTFRLILLCFIWGGAAFLFASGVNRWMLDSGLVETRDMVVRFTAPITEEILKGLILIYLVRRPQFTYFVDGAIYGFAAGIGFAIIENYEYIFNNLGAALAVAIGRVISTNLIHATGSALVGIAFGKARFERTFGKARFILGGFTFAMILHIGFNNLVTRVRSGLLLIYAAGVGIAGLSVIWGAIKRGIAEEQTWIKETLGEADRVTAGEAAAVQRLSDIEVILAPLAKRFGSEKASQIEHFLLLQAHLGIMRKTLEKLPDEKMVKSVELEMGNIRQEMDEARKVVGTYCMMYLRGIFPEDDSHLWGHFEDVITERLASLPATASGSLYSKLEAIRNESDHTTAFDKLG
ncbi:MAG: PrsW family intramembrane metalloprotease [Chloroflexi bacterium]|nr:PrsW family intramembrane metalloprotease [Chloroflexota bacterium]